MRTVLLISVALLLVALGLEHDIAHRHMGVAIAPEESPAKNRAVRVFSTGWNLMMREHGQRQIYKSLFVGSTEYNKHNNLGPGLTVIELLQEGGTGPMKHFNIGEKVEAGVALKIYLDKIEPLSVLLLGSNTKIGHDVPLPELYIEQLAGLFKRLDARSEPTSVRIQSFALICIKRKDGTFGAISEGFSTTNGVSLAHVIPADHSELLGITPTRYLDERRPVHLDIRQGAGNTFGFIGPKNFGQRYHDAISALVVRRSDSNGIGDVSFELGDKAIQESLTSSTLFTSTIAMDWSSNPKMLGVRFTLRINDLWIGDRVLLREPGDVAKWRAWEETIPATEEPIAKVTVEAEWLGDGNGQSMVYFAEPRLIGGQMRQL